jgi:hypothetical protein
MLTMLCETIEYALGESSKNQKLDSNFYGNEFRLLILLRKNVRFA